MLPAAPAVGAGPGAETLLWPAKRIMKASQLAIVSTTAAAWIKSVAGELKGLEKKNVGKIWSVFGLYTAFRVVAKRVPSLLKPGGTFGISTVLKGVLAVKTLLAVMMIVHLGGGDGDGGS